MCLHTLWLCLRGYKHVVYACMYVSGLYDSEGHDEEQQVALAYVATEATCISPSCVEMVK